MTPAIALIDSHITGSGSATKIVGWESAGRETKNVSVDVTRILRQPLDSRGSCWRGLRPSHLRRWKTEQVSKQAILDCKKSTEGAFHGSRLQAFSRGPQRSEVFDRRKTRRTSDDWAVDSPGLFDPRRPGAQKRKTGRATAQFLGSDLGPGNSRNRSGPIRNILCPNSASRRLLSQPVVCCEH
jgi:hypothetical protein